MHRRYVSLLLLAAGGLTHGAFGAWKEARDIFTSYDRAAVVRELRERERKAKEKNEAVKEASRCINQGVFSEGCRRAEVVNEIVFQAHIDPRAFALVQLDIENKNKKAEAVVRSDSSQSGRRTRDGSVIESNPKVGSVRRRSPQRRR